MTIPSAAGPPPGTIGTGELLVDVSSRTIWYGVPAGIDASESILLCDIDGFLAEWDLRETAANDYTDTVAAGKANTSHTHAIADVTGLQAALDAASDAIPAGCIIMWSGAIIDIPVGWVICDGANGTPDLRDKFVYGAGGTKSPLATGGAATFSGSTGSGGSHNHTGATSAIALTTAQLPSHTHPITDPGHTHVITDPGHQHNVADIGTDTSSNTYGIGNGNLQFPALTPTTVNTTGVTNQSAQTGVTAGNTGSGDTHAHSISTQGDHTHTISGATIPPYVALAYIQKLP